jgi:precorrin-8X/cobalt-precorrin-8 methylmutase
MNEQLTELQNLAIIDREIGNYLLPPAEYELARRVIYETSDFEYQFLIHCSEKALPAGAAALDARSTIVVDVPMVQVGIVPHLKLTFANPVYCSTETITRPQKNKAQVVRGIETLAKRYPEAIFVIGQSQTALTRLVELIEEEEIKPALVIATPAGLLGADVAKERLQDSLIPYITIKGCKGNAVVAVAIVKGLVDLAWLAYQQKNYEL